jgi:hypothetical protein
VKKGDGKSSVISWKEIQTMDGKVLFRAFLLASIVSFATGEGDNNLSNHEMNSSFKHPLSFVNDLSELPLEKLLKVRKSLLELRQTNFLENEEDNHRGAHEESLESRMIDGGNFYSNLHERNFGNGVAAFTDDKNFKRFVISLEDVGE